MLQELMSRMGFKWFCNMSRRQYRRTRNLIILAILLIITVTICIVHIDSVCGSGLKPLSVAEAMQAEASEPPGPQVPLYDLPLSRGLQEYTYWKCVEYNVDYIMALAIMQEESSFQPALSKDGNYGLMQINRGNHQYLRDALGTTDFLDPQQNIEAGIFWLSGIYENNSDPEKILMVYNMGGSIAQDLWDLGRESTGYSREVMRAMDEIRGKQVAP